MRSDGTDSLPRQSSARITGLDGLRAISILLVLFGHGSATIPGEYCPDWVGLYLGNASLGVTTFFVISGYLITYLLRREWEKAGTIRLKAFYFRRVLRIFPALYVYLLAMVFAHAVGWISTTYGDLAVAGTFLTNYRHYLPIATNDDYWFVGHFWTLSLEEQFYLFWPATILAVSLARAPYVAVAIILLAPPTRVISYFAFPDSRGQLGMMLHTAADPIMFGCLAALWQGKPRFEAILKRLGAWYWPLLASLFLCIVNPQLMQIFRGSYTVTIGMSLNALAIAFVLLWVVRHPASLPVRLLSTRPARHIGLLSYSLYLWQQPFLTSKNHSWSGQFPVNFIVCLLAAEISYWFVERPFLAMRDRTRQRDATAAILTGDKAIHRPLPMERNEIHR